ncbi:MAG: hypothetical protein GYA23_08510 [Methanomicrobiales archaeon]|nr:hypothetical protein [Methanomicrobiales archaeon]
MNGYPRDIFDEMDEMMDHLFTQMQGSMLSIDQPATGYRIVIENFGNTGFPGREEPVAPSRVSAHPVPEVHRIDDEVKVIAELPGASPESITLDLQGSIIVIDAGGPDMPYHTTAELPAVDPDSLQKTFRNGVLEVTLHALPEKPADTQG